MNSTKSIQAKPSRPPFKFLMRSLRLTKDPSIIQTMRVKGFYLKKLLANSNDIDFRFISKLFRNKQSHKTLKHAEMSSCFLINIYECLKSSKNLKVFSIKLYTSQVLSHRIVIAIRKLPAKVQSISISAGERVGMNKMTLYDIARCIRKFPKLQSFERGEIKTTEIYEVSIPKELAIYSRSVSRLKGMKRMMYHPTSLYLVIRRGFVNHGITGLQFIFFMCVEFEETPYEMDINNEAKDLFINFENMTPNEQRVCRKIKHEIKERGRIKIDEIAWPVKTLPDEDYEEEYTENDEREEWADPRFSFICRKREEMRLHFRFELFPDLKELNITLLGYGNPLGSFLIDAFSSLKKMENLKIEIYGRPMGTTYLFRAFLQLPLLKKFSFDITSLNNEEWGLFGHFVHAQTKIEDFHFGITDRLLNRTHYLQQNDYLKSTMQYFNPNLSLKSLHLDFSHFSLEALSKGLSHLQLKNQLHTFKFKVCDDILTSQKPPMKRVEGLCQFIKNQKESLKTLHISLPLTLEDVLVTYLAEAVSQLSQLKELSFDCNLNFYEDKILHYFQSTLQNEILPELQKRLARPEKWNPSLAKYFKKLANLEKFILKFDIICTEKTDPVRWFVDLVSILPSLENLRTLEIHASASTFERKSIIKEKERIAKIFLSLEYIKEISIILHNSYSPSHSKGFNLNRIVEKINERQARKSYFMFE